MRGFVDLFSGLCGASSAFMDSLGWRVLCIDNNPELKNHIAPSRLAAPNTEHVSLDITDTRAVIAVIENWMQAHDITNLTVWASPPCYEFSLAYSAPRAKAIREGEDYNPSMECLEATIDIINRLPVDCYIIENVAGAIRFFEPELGPVRQHIGPFFLWGNFPLISASKELKNHTKHDARHSPIRSNERAEIPFELSWGLKNSLVPTNNLDHWLV